MALTALASGDPSWTGTRNPDLYELFMHITPENVGTVPRRYTFDAVIVVRNGKNDPLQIHGIEIIGGFSFDLVKKLEEMAAYFDFMWVVVPEEAQLEKLSIPDFVGILCVTNSHTIVKRSARRSEQQGSRALEMTKGLLLKTLKR
jgi:hypothetical protein